MPRFTFTLEHQHSLVVGLGYIKEIADIIRPNARIIAELLKGKGGDTDPGSIVSLLVRLGARIVDRSRLLWRGGPNYNAQSGVIEAPVLKCIARANANTPYFRGVQSIDVRISIDTDVRRSGRNP
jgi:hypothetical protein